MDNILTIGKYNSVDYFITPDRKCEQFLYMRNILHLDMVKGETGWTYWVYRRNNILDKAIAEYVEFLAQRRKASGLWRPQATVIQG